MIYNDYIRVMTCMHQKLKHTYNQFCLKLLTEEQRNKYQLFPETAGLALPGAEAEKENSPKQDRPFGHAEKLDKELKRDSNLSQNRSDSNLTSGNQLGPDQFAF